MTNEAVFNFATQAGAGDIELITESEITAVFDRVDQALKQFGIN